MNRNESLDLMRFDLSKIIAHNVMKKNQNESRVSIGNVSANSQCFFPFARLFFLTMMFSALLLTKVSWATQENLIANASLEKAKGNVPAHWSRGQWGDLKATFEYPVAGHASKRAMKISVKSFSSGDAKWYFKDIQVNPKKEYIFSNWSKSSVSTEVTVKFNFINGSSKYVWLGTVIGTGEWKEFKTSFAVPVGAVSMTVLHTIGQNGFLIVENYSIQEVSPISRFSEGMVSFTFDDGFASAYNSLPILERAGIRSTQAIITGSLTGEGYVNPRYVTKEQVKEIAKRGHEIASHSRSHLSLVKLTEVQMQDEIIRSKQELANFGIIATSFMYPFGTYNEEIEATLKRAGYAGARCSNQGYATPLSDRFHILSQNVNSNTSFNTIKEWIDKAVAEKWWVVLTFHRQEKSTDNIFSNDPILLQQIVDYVKLKKVKTVTFGQGVAMLKR